MVRRMTRKWRVTLLSTLVGFGAVSAWLFSATPAMPQPVGHFTLVNQTTQIQYVVEGHGQDVVFLHGTDGSLNDFRLSPLWNLLPRDRFRLLAFDRPGRGNSTPGRYSLPNQVELTHTLLNTLRVRQPILVAHSWSGALAMAYTLRYPRDVKAIITLGGWVYPLKDPLPGIDSWPLLPGVGELFSRVGFRLRDSQINDLLDEGFNGPAPAVYALNAHKCWLWSPTQINSCTWEVADVNRRLGQLSQNYHNLHIPVVAIAGTADRAVPASQSKQLASIVPGARLLLIPGAPHYLQFTHALRVSEAISTVER